MEVIAEIQDEVSGAIPIRQRPGGERLYEFIDDRKVDAVIFYTVDRVSRDADVIEIHELRRDIRNAGMELHYVDSGQADLSSLGSIMDHVRAAVAADERKKLEERTTRGRNAKARAGKVVGGGRAPYGYRFANGSLEIVEDEAKIVREIFNLYVRGDESGKNLAIGAICRRLNDFGIKSPRDKAWQKYTVRSILINETYAGLWHYGKIITEHRKVKKRPKEEHIAVTVPAIVDRDTWELAQTQRQTNIDLNPRSTKRDYLLRSMFKCGWCGSAMVGVATKSGRRNYGYYQCRGKGGAESGGSRCRMTKFDQDFTEGYVWGTIAEIASSRETVVNEFRATRDASIKLHEAAQSRIGGIDKRLIQLETEANELAAKIRTAKSGSLAATVLTAQLTNASDESERLSTEKASLEAQIANAVLSDADIENAVDWVDETAAWLLLAEESERRQFMLDHQTRVTALGKGMISIEFDIGAESIKQRVKVKSIGKFKVGASRSTSHPTQSKSQTAQRPA